MSNPILLSEGFERTVYAFQQAVRDMPPLDVQPLNHAIADFERQVDRLRDVLGMQAENMQRAATGNSMAYVETDFQKV